MIEGYTMARPLRIEYPGALYHVTSRGNSQSNIFITDTDRPGFLEILESGVNRFNWICRSYCLMDNHCRLLIETPEGSPPGACAGSTESIPRNSTGFIKKPGMFFRAL